ncbi:MAG: hypothetical protein AAGA03_03205 [Planctomycetota bacterium]
MTKIARWAASQLDADRLHALANDLGVSIESLRSLGVGFAPESNATTWPMRNAEQQVVGIRMRRWGGSQKWSIKESRSGWFLPSGRKRPTKSLVVCEGGSDTAAALSLGLTAVGRASCNAPVHDVDFLVRRHALADSVVRVLADHDDAGVRGAERFADAVASHGFDAAVVIPPTRGWDFRDWVNAGARREDVLEANPVLTLSSRESPKQLTLSFGSATADQSLSPFAP